jgi:hypothetical protein
MARSVVDLDPEAIAEGREARGFPYRLIYWTEGDNSLVVAIAHSKRRPGYWKARLGPAK